MKHHFDPLCRRFAQILGGEAQPFKDGCLVTRFRDIDAKIQGRKTNSPLVNPQFFSFENLDCKGRALNLGETVIFQKEINRFIDALRKDGIIVTALHNHWLFDNPRLFYIHFQSIDHPLDFAKKVARALRLLD